MNVSSFQFRNVIIKNVIKTSALLQDKLFFSNYSQVLDDHFAALKMSVDGRFTGIILILTQIRVW